MSDSDLGLAQLAASGDVEAFHALLDRHSPGLLRLAQWLCGNRADAEDAVQEALVAAYRGVRGFDGRSSFKTWITRIVIRQGVRIRQRTRRHAGSASLASLQGRDSTTRIGPAVESPAGQVDQRIDLAAGISALAEDHRQVILLREVQGLSYDEIAQVLGVPRGTVESRLHRARLALREKLGAYLT